jgi:F-type H+-transporting ATPase subunit epsilon
MSEFKLQVYTPAGKVFAGSANSVKLPSSNGEIGILPGHVNYVGLLGTGVLELSGTEGSRRIAVSGGCVSVESDTLSILADYAVTPEKVQPDYAAERQELLDSLKGISLDAPQAKRAQEKLALIKAVDALVSN